MSASFQSPEDGFEHQSEMPDVPGPDDLRSELEITRSFKDRIPERVREQYTCDRPIEIRPIDPVSVFHPEKRPPVKYAWIRANGAMPSDLTLSQCLLAYTSDFGLLGTSLRPHAVTFYTPGMQTASLDHAMWFHRDFCMNQWLLYAMDSPSASRGRGFNRGNIFTREGVLVASVVQEGLIRRRKA
jgi:acyl-CoA thioesterase-2